MDEAKDERAQGKPSRPSPTQTLIMKFQVMNQRLLEMEERVRQNNLGNYVPLPEPATAQVDQPASPNDNVEVAQSVSDFEFNEIDDMAVNANAEERFNQEQVLDFRQIEMIEEDELDDQFNVNSADGDFVEDFGEDAI